MYDKGLLEQIAHSHEQWRDEVLDPSLKRYPHATQISAFDGPIVSEVIYSPLDVHGQLDLGDYLPDEYPFTRGSVSNYSEVRLPTGVGTPENANGLLHYLAARISPGPSGLRRIAVQVDSLTTLGLDSDDPTLAPSATVTGVPLSTVDDLSRIMEGFSFDDTCLYLPAAPIVPLLLAFAMEASRRQNVGSRSLVGAMQNDPFAVSFDPQSRVFPLRTALRLMVDSALYCVEHLPQWKPVGISGEPYRMAGANIVQELTLTIAGGLASVEALLEKGLSLARSIELISFFFQFGSDFLWEIAKVRAARRMWARQIRRHYGATVPEPVLRCHAHTAGSLGVTGKYEHEVSRVTLQSIAATLGGTETILSVPSLGIEQMTSQQIAVLVARTHQIRLVESKIDEAVDPLGGAYCIEQYTRILEEKATASLHLLAEAGNGSMLQGMLKHIESGDCWKEIGSSSAHMRSYLRGKRVVGTVDKFDLRSLEKVIPSKIQGDRSAQLEDFRRRRKAAQVSDALAAMDLAITSNQPLFPHFIDAARAGATLGEIAAYLRDT